MGRPRKPAAKSKLDGNPGKRPIRDEPQYAAKLPAPPAFIKGAGLREWKRLGPRMTAQGVLTEADYAVFVQYCDAWQRRAALHKEHAKAKIGTDEWRKLDIALDRVEKQLTKAVTELGLSPVTRSKAARELKKDAENEPFTVFEGGKQEAKKSRG